MEMAKVFGGGQVKDVEEVYIITCNDGSNDAEHGRMITITFATSGDAECGYRKVFKGK